MSDEPFLTKDDRALGEHIERLLEPLQRLGGGVKELGVLLPELQGDAELLAVSTATFLTRLRRHPRVRELLTKMAALRELAMTEDEEPANEQTGKT